MRKPHTSLTRTVLLAALCACAAVAAPSHGAATPDARASQGASAKPTQESRAPDASEAGDASKAEESCARGEALSKRGDTRGALEALGESARLYARVYLDAPTPVPPPAADAPARFRAEMAARLRRAPQCLELYARLGGREGANDFERSQLEALRAHAVGITESDASRVVYFGPETDTRAVITYRPQPRFPREARRDNLFKTVRLRVVLGADGEARDPLVLSGSESAFLESSAEAAKGTQFKPAVKGGRAVSQFVTLEYNFSTH